jgi:hypothetical protein
MAKNSAEIWKILHIFGKKSLEKFSAEIWIILHIYGKKVSSRKNFCRNLEDICMKIFCRKLKKIFSRVFSQLSIWLEFLGLATCTDLGNFFIQSIKNNLFLYI